jgi:hypothetical protein
MRHLEPDKLAVALSYFGALAARLDRTNRKDAMAVRHVIAFLRNVTSAPAFDVDKLRRSYDETFLELVSSSLCELETARSLICGSDRDDPAA